MIAIPRDKQTCFEYTRYPFFDLFRIGNIPTLSKLNATTMSTCSHIDVKLQ